MRIHIFHTGGVRVDRAVPYRERNPLATTGLFRGKDKKLELPVSCYLIEHPRGPVLLDTGWDSRYAAERPRQKLGLLDKISAPVLHDGESVDRQLAALGIAPRDLYGVFLSHLDFDHTSGLTLVRDAPHIWAAAEEIDDARRYRWRYVCSDWDGIVLQPFAYQNTGLGPAGKSFDVFGDGKLVLVNTPGHSHGHCSALVRGERGYVLLAGDAVYTQRSLAEHILPGFTVDAAAAQRSVDWVCRCAADPNCLLVAPNHDPAIQPQTITL